MAVLDTPTEPSDSQTIGEAAGPQQISAFAPRILEAGFILGVVIAVGCLLLSGWYMLKFEDQANGLIATVAANGNDLTPTKLVVTEVAVEAHMYIARVLLVSCGIFVGMAFGFLGFSLFLIGVQGNISASSSFGNAFTVSAARLSPGIFAIVCSTILIGLCATRDLPVTLDLKPANTVLPAAGPSKPPNVDHRQPPGNSSKG